jgi:hypothetical protein
MIPKECKRLAEVDFLISVVGAFTQLRKMLSTHADLKRKIESMEKKYDEQFKIVFEAIKQLLSEEDKPKKIYPAVPRSSSRWYWG